VHFRMLITGLILMDVIAFVLQSDAQLNEEYATKFDALEAFSSLIFFLEFAVRLSTIYEAKQYRSLTPSQAHLSFLLSWEAVIDILSFLPWFLEVAFSLRSTIFQTDKTLDLPNLSALRLLRLSRLLKNWQVLEAFDIVSRVLYFNAEILFCALVICGIMIIVTSTLLYFFRPNNHADFQNIPATTYLSIMMLTGQGQPEGELPWYTKVICSITSIFAVAQFAIPASMLTWGFEQEAARRIKKAAQRRAGTKEDDSSGDSTLDFAEDWREYEDEVLGSDSDEEKAKLKEVPSAAVFAASPADQLMAFAQRFQAMEQEIAALKAQMELKDQEIARLKADPR